MGAARKVSLIFLIVTLIATVITIGGFIYSKIPGGGNPLRDLIVSLVLIMILVGSWFLGYRSQKENN